MRVSRPSGVALLLPAQREAHPAGHVLGERDHVRAAAEVLDGTRLERAHHLGAGTVLGRERALRARHLDRAHHTAVEVGHRRVAPADHLALADAVVAHGARHLAPRTVGHDRLMRTVCVRDLQLGDRAREVAPRRHVEVPRGDGAHVVPAVAHEDPQRVRAGLEVAVEAVGGVEHMVVVRGGRGVEHLVADLRAVEGRLVEADARHVQDGGGDRLRHGERLLEGGRGDFLAQVEGLAVRRVAHAAEVLSPRGVRHETPPVREAERADERLRRAVFLLHDHLHLVLPGLQPRRHVAEAQPVPTFDMPGVLVARLAVDDDLVLRGGGVDQLHVLARLRAREVERTRERHVALRVGSGRHPARAAQVGVGTRFGRGTDPLRLPVGRLHHAHRELPIHFAFQSDGFTTPIVNSAGSDQSLSLP